MNLTNRPVTPKSSGNDRPFLDWLKTLPCCVCEKLPPCDPAHVRLNGRGGMGMKPRWSAVPLCRSCHDLQHHKGHSSIMPTEIWLELADKYLEKYFSFCAK